MLIEDSEVGGLVWFLKSEKQLGIRPVVAENCSFAFDKEVSIEA